MDPRRCSHALVEHEIRQQPAATAHPIVEINAVPRSGEDVVFLDRWQVSRAEVCGAAGRARAVVLGRRYVRCRLQYARHTARPRCRVGLLLPRCHPRGRARAPRWARWYAHTRPILGAHRRARDPVGVVPAPRDAFAKLFWKHDLEGADPADSTAGSGVWTVDASGSRKSTAGDPAPPAPGRCTCV